MLQTASRPQIDGLAKKVATHSFGDPKSLAALAAIGDALRDEADRRLDEAAQLILQAAKDEAFRAVIPTGPEARELAKRVSSGTLSSESGRVLFVSLIVATGTGVANEMGTRALRPEECLLISLAAASGSGAQLPLELKVACGRK